ncbi:MAG: AI-2E family transporter [Gammaproteobacteria bacterium RBG_16_57_12]|nr:MAG: AI-2E family transporter [Gammaproteobacteria bacterium RBG_16_57_12]
MSTERPEIPAAERWAVLAGVLIGGGLIYLLAPILTPFLVSAILAYLCDPLVDRLQRYKLSRTVAVVVVYLLLFFLVLLLLLVLVPVLYQQLVALIQSIPAYLELAQNTVLPWLAQQLGLAPDTFDMGHLKQLLSEQWQAAGSVLKDVIGSVLYSGMTALSWIMNLVLIPVVTFYLLRDWDVMLARLHELLPRSWEPDVVRLARNTDEVLGAFMRGQMLVMLALGAIYALGLWLVGREFALLIGMLAGLLSFVPYLGLVVGILVAGVAGLMQFHDIVHLLLIAGVFVVGQLLEGMVLTPKLVGDRIGLHPVAVIFAVLAGAQLFGFVGVLLALPVAAVAMVLLRFAQERYRHSQLFSR